MHNMLKIMQFSIGSQCYALNLADVLRVTRAVAISGVPRSAQSLLGVVNVHGDIIPVINLRLLLGLDQTQEIQLDNSFIIVKIQTNHAILVADTILSINVISYAELVPAQTLFNSEISYVKGILKNDNGMTFLLDIEKLLSENELSVLNQAIQQEQRSHL